MLNKYYNAVTNKSGDALPGYFVRLFDSNGGTVDLYADESMTPIISVSGVANAALVDDDGMVRFYHESGTYDLRYYDTNDEFKASEPAVPLIRGLSEVELAGPTGGDLVGFEQGASYATGTLGAKALDNVSVKDAPYNATGDGSTDDTAAVQDALDSLTAGGILRFPRGTYLLDSTVTISNDNVVLEFEAGAGLLYTDPTLIPIKITGQNCGISGGAIDAPATFDGTNSALTYSVVWVEGDGCSITGLKINNVPRAGINFKDCNNGVVSGCVINGGTSDTFFTGTNTVHAGINIDPPGTGSQGGHAITGNLIRACVQGVVSGAVGGSSLEQSMAISGNVFEQCWNHGVYAGGLAHGWAVSGNAFSGCQVPVALTGYEHVVDGNSLTVQTTGTGVITDNEMTGISMRDPVRCIVSNNVIKGENVNGGVVIGMDDLNSVSGANRCSDNIVSNNVICITNTTVAGVIAIRLLSESGNVSGNVVEGNTVSAPLRSGEGLIVVQGAGTASVGNSVKNNTVLMTGIRGGGYGFALVNLHTTDCSGNMFSIQCDAGSAMTLTIFALASNTFSTCYNNVISCTSAWGANITVRCFQELTAATDNFVGGTRVSLDPTKLAGQTLFFSAMIIDHLGTGTPEGNVLARVGSIWRRRDGGAGTGIYIKESGTSNTGWIGK